MKLLKLRLIDDWKQCYKFLTVQLSALFGVLAVAYEYIPAIQQYFPDGWIKYALAIIIVGRIINQSKDETKP